ncbi:hypothetical protein PFISCL1PPCAC_28316, partial [Pristionchus fissidentatus]
VLLLLTAATAAGQTMSILPVNSSGPIPPPGPSCATMRCSPNTTCVDLPTGSVCQANGETCYPVAVPPTSNVCTNHTCPLGQKCTVIQVNCLIPPCAPIPSCVRESSSNLTCATVKCTANSTCVQLPRGPVCKPNRGPEHPCNMMECAAGFFCVVQHGEADCVKRSGASCAATSCPVNTTCIEFKEGAQCMSGILTGGCANITCGGGARCKETPNGARCISGGRRDDRVVDIFGCGRGEQYTQCMPRCEDTCRGIQTCDLSIPLRPSNISLGMNDTVATNGTVWANATILSNSTINNNSTMGGNWTTPNLPSTCVPGCMCRDRFKRNVQGNCVPNNRCWLTPGCRDNETWSKCRGCEKTCDAPFSAAPCTAICQSGCACDEGFVRCKMGMCVLPEDCRAMDLISGGHGNLTIAG